MKEPTEFDIEMMMIYIGYVVPLEDFEQYMRELENFWEQERETLKSVSQP